MGVGRPTWCCQHRHQVGLPATHPINHTIQSRAGGRTAQGTQRPAPPCRAHPHPLSLTLITSHSRRAWGTPHRARLCNASSTPTAASSAASACPFRSVCFALGDRDSISSASRYALANRLGFPSLSASRSRRARGPPPSLSLVQWKNATFTRMRVGIRTTQRLGVWGWWARTTEEREGWGPSARAAPRP